jgi:predicted permease
MNWITRILRRKRMTADLAEELQQHLDEKVDALVAQGMPREEAIHAARRAFGNATLLEERSREVWMWPWLENLRRDVRFALRQLRRSPGFTLTAILILALGIGANTAMFTVVDAVLLHTVPYADVHNLILIDELDKKSAPTMGVTYPDAMEWMQKSRNVAGVALLYGDSNFLRTSATTEKVLTIHATANLFSVLGVQPALGRTFTPAEQTPGRDNVVILSDSVWKTQFHRDPGILGKAVQLDGNPYFIVGVMPSGFSYPFSETDRQVWTPLALAPAVLTRGNQIVSYATIARLRPGVSLAAAQAELSGLQRGIAKEYPGNYFFPKPVGVRVQSYRKVLFHQFRPTLLLLQLACGILWLIACANVGALLLVRSTVRQRELAVREALGASRKRLVWQSLLDSLLLSIGGAAVGLGLATLALWGFQTALLHRIHALQHIHLNLAVLAALAVLSVVTALVFGAVPAWMAARAPVTQMLQQGGPLSTAGSHPKRLRDALMVAEIALSLTLLIACGLLLRTLYALRHVPLGIRTEHVITADLAIPGYRYQDRNIVTTLYQPLLEKAQHLPDVMAASLSTTVPLDQGFHVMLTMYQAGTQKAGTSRAPGYLSASFGAMSKDTQRVFGFRMLRGRFFDAHDTRTSQPVVIVNQAFADQWTRDADILGKTLLHLRASDKREAIVAGIMSDLPAYSLADLHEPQVYLCMDQLQPGDSLYDAAASTHMQLAVRTREDPAAVVSELRTLLIQTAPELRSTKIETMDQVVEDSLGDQKLAAHLLEIFGGTALLITLTGLYGSLLYMVSLRRRELAIRLALGAQRSQIMRLIAAQAATLLAVGLGLGIALSLATARFVRGYLYGVPAHDPWTVLTVSLLFVACAVLAAYIPARRASRVDPMQALRAE